jgi:putative ABC transport system permease protein
MARRTPDHRHTGARSFRALLALYPREFRDEYGREMAMVFADRHRDALNLWERALIWLEGVSGVLIHAPKEHCYMILQELRYAFRSFRRNPIFSTTVVLTLALGIGANTAVFSLISGVLLRPLPYPDPERIVTVAESNRPNDVAGRNLVAPANFLDWRSQSQTFERMGAYETSSYNLSTPGEPERIVGAAMSYDVLAILSVQPFLGRGFRLEDDRPSATPVVLLSERLWKRRFHADAGVLTQSISINGEPYVVIGVMPAGFRFPDQEVELWVPLERQVTPVNMHWRGSHYLSIIARLKKDIGIGQARAEMNRIAATLKRQYAKFTMAEGAVVLPLRDDLVQDVRRPLLVLFGAVSLVLLIACANVANLLLVRAGERQREISVRAALGAGNWRIARQLIVESALFSVCGGLFGVALAALGKEALLVLRPMDLPRIGDVRIDGWVLAFSLAVSLATTIIFGFAPTLGASHIDLREALQAGARLAGSSTSGRRLRDLLVVSEVALSVVLLVGAGLLIRSFARLESVDTGFRPSHMLTARVSLPRAGYSSDAEIVKFYDRLIARVRELAGGGHVATIMHLPLTGHQFDNSFSIEGRPTNPGQAEFALLRAASSDYFRLFGIPVLVGRGFNEFDGPNSRRVAVVSHAMARRYWPNESAIGKRMTIYMAEHPQPSEVIGIVGDVRTEINQNAQPMIYLPYAQQPFRSMVLAVETSANDAGTAQALRRVLQSLDPDQPIYEVRTLEGLVAETLAPWRFSLVLLTTFAGLALVLAAVGLFGVMSRLVTERTPEIGIRMALGARQGDVLGLVLRHSFRLVAVGVAIGCAGATAATRVLASMLYRTAPTDAATFIAAVMTLGGVATVAVAVPALRAARVDPLVALRQE